MLNHVLWLHGQSLPWELSMWLSISIAFIIYTLFISNLTLSTHHNCFTISRSRSCITSTRCPLRLCPRASRTGRHLQYCHCLTIGLPRPLTGELTTLWLTGLSSECTFQSLDTGEPSPPLQFFCRALYQCRVFESSRACSLLQCIAFPSTSELSFQAVKQINDSDIVVTWLNFGNAQAHRGSRFMSCDVAIPEPLAPQLTTWLVHSNSYEAENLYRVLL